LIARDVYSLLGVVESTRERRGNMKSDPFKDEIIELVKHYCRAILKAPLIGIMIFFSLCSFNVSYGKSLLVAFICLAISLINTWRRFLEPVSFVMLHRRRENVRARDNAAFEIRGK
jgi:hypothetical protein